MPAPSPPPQPNPDCRVARMPAKGRIRGPEAKGLLIVVVIILIIIPVRDWLNFTWSAR